MVNAEIRNSAHPVAQKQSKWTIRDRIAYYIKIYDNLGPSSRKPAEERRKLDEETSELEYPFYYE